MYQLMYQERIKLSEMAIFFFYFFLCVRNYYVVYCDNTFQLFSHPEKSNTEPSAIRPLNPLPNKNQRPS